MFKPLSPTPVSGRSMAAMFGSRSLAFVCSIMVVLMGFLVNASAQDKPADSQPSTTVATGQTLSGDSSQAQAAPVVDPAPEQRLVHIVPYGRGTSASPLKNTSAPAGAHLTYFGGPVISNIHVVIVFWGTNVDPVVTTPGTIDQFFADITNSRYYDLLTEYSTLGVTGSGTPVASSNQTIGRGEFDATVTIIPSACPGGPTSCSLTDNQIQTELTNQLAAGHLPPPVKDSQGIIETFYMIYFPPGVHISAGGLPSCAKGGFCAYHSNTSSLVPYGVLPDFGPTSGCQNPHCGNGTEFQNITSATSHEMSEAVTDVQVASATVFGPPLAWYDPDPAANPLGEIGDICNQQDVTVSAGGHTYTVQQEFSNLQGDCVSAPPVFNLTTPASGAGPSLPFNGTLTIQSSVSPFTLTGYRGTVHFTSSDPQAVLPADYTFLSTDTGSHQFSFTLNTLGNQTITVTDTHSAGFTGTATVNVNLTPDLAITKSHTGNFSVGQTGATYTITVSNPGHGPTTAAVTVVDSLPSGLTATAISGTGWTCTLGTLTCTRPDALAANSSYPAITLTVNVAANAPSLVTNSATVSGGGETNSANNSASDPTAIAAPDMTVSKTHAGVINGSFFQGETGAIYTIFVENSGNLATTAPVTVVDTLPPAGFTATGISGTGWSCTLATLTCTRNDALGPNLGYPVITVTVDIALDAPSGVFNTATVSGGGEVNTGNNISKDLTLVLPPPAPDLSINIFNPSIFVQGQTGTYSITISNVGTAVTSAAVTVADTLPTGLTATSINGTGWTCTLGSTSSCTRSDPLAFNGSYPNITLTVAIASDAPPSVTNMVNVSGGGDTNLVNNSVSNSTVIATPLVDLSPNVSGTGFAAQGQTNVSFTIFINNIGNVASAGTVTAVATVTSGLTTTAISGTGWNCTLSSLTCTRSDALNAFSPGFPGISLTVNVANNAPATAGVSVSVAGGGDGNSTNNTASATISISPLIGINAIGAVAQTVTAGTPGLFQIDVNPQPTAGGPANLSCSGLPTGTSCSFNPPSVPFVPGGTIVNLTISTTARTAIVTDSPGGPQSYKPLLPLLFLLLTALAGASLRHRLEPGRRLKPAFVLSGLLMLAALSGCGGGGSQGTPIVQNPQGTPAGTYSVTVTATSPNGTNSTTVTLVVR